MGLHTSLQIHKVAYELLMLVAQLAKNMPRDFKASIGGTLRDECVQITVLIFRANVATDKEPHPVKLLERQQVAELMIRLSRDMRLISPAQYAKAVELTSSIGKQANGWRRHSAAPVSSRSRPS